MPEGVMICTKMKKVQTLKVVEKRGTKEFRDFSWQSRDTCTGTICAILRRCLNEMLCRRIELISGREFSLACKYTHTVRRGARSLFLKQCFLPKPLLKVKLTHLEPQIMLWMLSIITHYASGDRMRTNIDLNH